MDKLYRCVFSNLYISTKIFTHVHQIQLNDYSLKYDVIVDAGWMYRNGHIKLLKEKINNTNIKLYVCNKELFSLIANADTCLFIVLFERTKDSALDYLDSKSAYDDFLSNIRNKEVLVYLHKEGHLKRIKFKLVGRMRVDVVEYLVDTGYMVLTPNVLLHNRVFGREYNGQEVNREYNEEEMYLLPDKSVIMHHKREMVELVLKHVAKPISQTYAQQIMAYLYSNPTLYIYELLSPHFDPGIEKTKIEINNQIKVPYSSAAGVIERHLETLRQRASIYQYRSKPIDLVHLIKQDCRGFWMWLLKQGDEAFFSLSTQRITTSLNAVFFYFGDIESRDEMDPSFDSLDVYPDILEAACMHGCVKVIKYFIDSGFNSQRINTRILDHSYTFFKSALRHTSDEYRGIMTDLAKFLFTISCAKILQSCCEHGYVDNLNFYLARYKVPDDSQTYQETITHFYDLALYNNHKHICRALEAQGHPYSDCPDDNLRLIERHGFKYMLDDVRRHIDRVQDSNKTDMILELLKISAIHNDFVGFKFILTEYIKVVKGNIIDVAAMMIAHSSNLAIIDHVYQHNATYFESPATFSLFVKKLYQSSADQNNFQFMEYITNETNSYSPSISEAQLYRKQQKHRKKQLLEFSQQQEIELQLQHKDKKCILM
ncbi:hypothetical protein CYY_004558 [Polysphondylium violaceum]|uniref:Uncharacterized protein n=1 Tax=Polysphondylium violaceum TaxID=133409 RepID=A0A8J4USX3_9MYCE|nr:hypothetical protein CYY_004558 [Polysphondylium violaceum]